MELKIRRASAQDAAWLQASFAQQTKLQKRKGYFADCCRQQEEGQIVLLVAESDGDYLGHVKVVWDSEVPYFRENGIPEIQDLIVVPAHRRRGIATHLLDEAETIIRGRTGVAGICFGLYADYGPAQRLYVLRGYVPDGKGIIYKASYVRPGHTVIADDDLVLCLTKMLE
jgi:ribosomal protein S18 acetylase RimI-like enzyme